MAFDQPIIKASGRAYCPNRECRIYIGKVSGLTLDVGLVFIGERPATLYCHRCKQPFTFRPPDSNGALLPILGDDALPPGYLVSTPFPTLK